jgi:hypothetical protein
MMTLPGSQSYCEYSFLESLSMYILSLYVYIYIYIQQQQEMAMEENAMEMENAYHQQRVRDYNSQVPLAFRVQPIQPNLQERM